MGGYVDAAGGFGEALGGGALFLGGGVLPEGSFFTGSSSDSSSCTSSLGLLGYYLSSLGDREGSLSIEEFSANLFL